MACRIFLFSVLLFINWNLCAARIQTSSPKFSEFFTLENQIVEGLGKYLDHEKERLDIIRNATGYEDEVPLVEERLEIMKSVHENAVINASALSEDIRLLRAQHPTSSYIAIKNFITNWTPLMRNETLFGFRLMEFLNVSRRQVFDYSDLHNIKNDIVYTHLFYNLSAADIYNGYILGVKGEPLSLMDAYDIARHARDSRKLRVSLEWFELAMSESKRVKNETDISMPYLLSELSLLYAHFGDDEKAERFGEEAFEYNTTDDKIHKRYMQVHTNNLKPMADFDDIAPIYWKNFTELCQANTTYQGPMQWYHRCRLRCSPNPLRRYKEEILSIAPYVSVFYDIIDDDIIDEIKSKSAGNLSDINTDYYRFLHGAAVDPQNEFDTYLSHLASDISGMNATYLTNSLSGGTAFDVLKFGFSGRATPHNQHIIYDPRLVTVGPKTATVAFYLSDVENGGATVFLDIGLRYQPKKGSALLMVYVRPNGDNDDRLTKAECAHALGEKWMLQKDIYLDRHSLVRPCALKKLGNQVGLDRAVHRFRHCRL